MKITTWNVNSIRSRLEATKKVIEELQPDILCLQETKVIDDLFPYDFFKSYGYIHNLVRGEISYNGVAILSKIPFSSTQDDIIFKEQTRHLIIRLQDIEIHNFYVPAGGDIPDPSLNQKFATKLHFLDIINKFFKNNRQHNDKLIVLGDLNVAPLENDVWSHKQLLDVVSHTPIEVEKYSNFQKSLNFFDAHRHFTPQNEKLYSWWSYRNRDWQKSNRGRRLDHILLTEPLKKYLKSADIFKNARNYTKPSDHVPVSITIK
ncbi:MAG: exodeoxyribonuclease III [Rickettsiales bacterium]|nr:exodeoxyribonuclease III [Rickettsiales bacterium]